ncbi:hypothetical protein J5N97_029437 [Dioscorea zingiberensis]|uniref:Uncharacterized protein n=1 Tax=Dioscorea zingiberensis TaxID=325984 RepID=A0A9D5C0U2_9LILI|nr:hypothetical protein J5N97_029437 [Dioscorea zingiberensis]
MAGGSVIRPAGRTVIAGVGAPAKGTPSAKPPSLVSFSPSSSVSLASHQSSIDGEGEKREVRVSHSFVFGRVPSMKEAEDAISLLKQMFARLSLSQVFGDGYVHNSDKESKIPSSIEANQRPNASCVLDAFRLLKSNISVQRMVVSLASDEAVWNAVMNNKAVRELRASLRLDNRLHAAETGRTDNSNGGHDIVGMILQWIYASTMGKIMEIIGNIMQLLPVLFHSQEKEKNLDIVDNALRSSLMLTVMVFIIVVVTRIQSVHD